MKITWRTELCQLLLIAGMFAAAALCWAHAPDRIPVHWNLHGEVDSYGGKFAGLLLLPLITLGLYLALLLLPRLDPGRANYQQFATAYNVIRVALVCFMAAVYAVVLLAALGSRIDVGSVVPIATGALLVVLGNFMGKIRPNWFVGVRTPWTLSSKESWNKTHRLAGWMFILLGLLIAAQGIWRTGWMAGATMSAGVACIVWLFVYSYLVYRKDPHRTTPAGTSPGTE